MRQNISARGYERECSGLTDCVINYSGIGCHMLVM